MFVYRIAKKTHIRDLSGTGARLYGGRWNHKGVSLIYTSESRALAIVEFLVNIPMSLVPNKLSIATLKIATKIIPKEITITDLPRNWRDYPSPTILADIGTQWIVSNESALLRVPSAVVEDEFNILINPSHPDMKHVTIADIKDSRLGKRMR
ncbi:RES family NAD+ phosphorylase [Acidobacteriota bacterium]